MKDDAELLADIRNGALDQFATLVQRHQAQVFSILGRYERDPHQVEDLAQETFLKSWRALPQFDGRAPFAHWLARIATRVALDHLRRTRRGRQEIPLSVLGETALDWLHSDESEAALTSQSARELLDAAMEKLSAEDHLVITLQEIQGWSIKEISDMTGWPGVLVRVRAHRARKKLAEILRKLKGEGG